MSPLNHPFRLVVGGVAEPDMLGGDVACLLALHFRRFRRKLQVRPLSLTVAYFPSDSFGNRNPFARS